MCQLLVLMSSYCSHFTFGCGLPAACPLLCLFFLRRSVFSALLDPEATVPRFIEAAATVFCVCASLRICLLHYSPKASTRIMFHILAVTTYKKSN